MPERFLSFSFSLILMGMIQRGTITQPLIQLPQAIPSYGLYPHLFHEAIEPFQLTDSLCIGLVWDLRGLSFSPPVARTDSVLPPDTLGTFSVFAGATMTVFKPVGDERSFVKWDGTTLWSLGEYSPYDDRLNTFLEPVRLWWDTMASGSTMAHSYDLDQGPCSRHEVVATGRLITAYGTFNELVMVMTWRDPTEPAEAYELVDPKNVLAPLAQFWHTGTVHLFERVGFEGLEDRPRR